MEGVQVSIDRIVVEFTDVYWDFFNPFQLRLRECLNANLRLKKRVKYHLHVRDRGHYPYHDMRRSRELIKQTEEQIRLVLAQTDYKLARFAGIAPIRFNTGGKCKDQASPHMRHEEGCEHHIQRDEEQNRIQGGESSDGTKA